MSRYLSYGVRAARSTGDACVSAASPAAAAAAAAAVVGGGGTAAEAVVVVVVVALVAEARRLGGTMPIGLYRVEKLPALPVAAPMVGCDTEYACRSARRGNIHVRAAQQKGTSMGRM